MDISDLYVGVRDLNLQPVGTILPIHLDLQATVAHGGVGQWTLTLPRELAITPEIQSPGAGIYVIQRLPGGASETLFSGPLAKPSLSRKAADAQGLVTLTGYTDDIILNDTLAWGDPLHTLEAQAQSNDSRTGTAEAVMKAYVNANLGPGALMARRGRLAQALTIETSLGRGPSVTRSPRFTNLLTLLQDIAGYAGLGFRVVQQGTGLVFQVYEPQDRRALVRFSLDNGSLSEETIVMGAPSVTSTIVAGQGEGVDRTLIQRTTPDSLLSETTWGRKIEQWIDQRNTNVTAELQQAGDEPLIAGGFTGVSVKAIPTEDTNMKFGQDWGLGDTVAIIVNGVEEVATVTQYALVANSSGVVLGAALGDVSSFSTASQLSGKISSLESAVAHLQANAEGASGVVAATPNTLALRDAAARFKVANPAAATDVANKQYVDALGVTSATANTIMRRDAAGRTQVADPVVSADAANKNYVDDSILVATRGVIPASIAVGSGSASVDANGLITFTGVSRLSLNGVFPDIAGSKFRLDWRSTNTAAGAVYCRMRNAGTDSVTGYNYIGAYYNYGTGWTKYQSFGTSLFGYMWPNPVANAPAVAATMTLDQPGTIAATECHVVGLVGASDRYRIDEYGECYNKTDGISILAGAGTMTGTAKIVRIS